jgi:hypothetical protein
MRIPILLALFGGIVFAAANVHTTTYVVGNLDNVSAGAIGTVNLSDANAIVFRTRETTVEVAYPNISKAELGARVTHTPDVPLYKVWQLHKRLLAPRDSTQYLTVDFKSANGEDRTMTLELDTSVASDMLAVIEIHQGKRPAAVYDAHPDQWWGDGTWRTNRNTPKWSPSGSGAVEPAK